MLSCKAATADSCCCHALLIVLLVCTLLPLLVTLQSSTPASGTCTCSWSCCGLLVLLWPALPAGGDGKAVPTRGLGPRCCCRNCWELVPSTASPLLHALAPCGLPLLSVASPVLLVGWGCFCPVGVSGARCHPASSLATSTALAPACSIAALSCSSLGSMQPFSGATRNPNCSSS